MKKVLAICAVCLSLVTPGFAQDEEESGGFLQTKLEESLSGEGRIVKITGFKGALSSTATMDKMTVADDDGIWLILEGASLNWKRSALLKGEVLVEEMIAERLEVVRKPLPGPSAPPSAEATEFSLPSLPVSIEIGNVDVQEVVLGEDVVGMPLELSLKASASLVSGTGRAVFAAERIDGPVGAFSFDGGYAGDTQEIDVEFAFNEAAEGIVAQLLKIPDEPALEAKISGHGPLADFVADFFLASGGTKNIEGRVELLREPFGEAVEGAQTPETAQGFKLDMGGDVTALFAPEYRSFFGPELSLSLEGQREPSGALDLAAFSVQAQTLDLQGRARLSPEAWPVVLDVKGYLASPDGTPVLLPLSGAQTQIESLILQLAYDAQKGPDWEGSLGLVGLVQEGVELAAARLSMEGEFDEEAQVVTGVNANVTFASQGLVLADPALSEALGPVLNGRAFVDFKPDTPLVVHDVSVQGKGVSFEGDFDIGSASEGFPTDLTAALKVANLTQFAALAQQPLKGAADLSVAGSVEPLSGIFDVIIQGETRDLAVGIAQADPLIAGVGSLYLDAVRNSEGTEVRSFKIATSEVKVNATADIETDAVTFDYDAELRDLAVIFPEYPGAVTLKGKASQMSEGIVLESAMTGPLGTSAKVAGLATGPNANVAFEAHLENLGALVAELPGTVDLKGTVEKQGENWKLASDLASSMGISSTVSGLVLANRDLDINITGAAPLGLAGPFIKPRTLTGTAQFDLAVKGTPSLEAVSGQITIANAEVVAPELQVVLREIGAKVTIGNSALDLDATANVSSGGSMAVQGRMGLVGGFESDLALALTEIQLSDPALYSTSVNGNVAVQGPLLGGALISGLIEIGQTEIIVPAGSIASVTSIPDIVHVGASPAVLATLERSGLNKKPKETASASKAAGPEYPLDLTISAPNQIFVRGRGIDAELGGEIKLSGTTANLVSIGSFKLRRGRINVLEKRFELTEGEVLLEGNLDPRLNLRATTKIPDGEASIVVGGFLSEPEITFESSPQAPEDEVLALIFFGVSIEDMTAFQSLQLASAVATLTGRGGPSVLGKLRDNLAVDDLEVDTNEDGVATVGVGKRLTEDLYSNVSVSAAGDTEISLNYDFTDKFTATGTTASDGNTSVGVFFNTDY